MEFREFLLVCAMETNMKLYVNPESWVPVNDKPSSIGCTSMMNSCCLTLSLQIHRTVPNVVSYLTNHELGNLRLRHHLKLAKIYMLHRPTYSTNTYIYHHVKYIRNEYDFKWLILHRARRTTLMFRLRESFCSMCFKTAGSVQPFWQLSINQSISLSINKHTSNVHA